jgi:ribosomal protein S18 acetylase RimI-like enzyme
MEILVREYRSDDLDAITSIWNAVVEEGVAFPQTDSLDPGEARAFFKAQSFTAVAEADGEIFGLYILHPNNVGRCGHIANASYAVRASARGLGIGRKLVEHSLKQGGELGFKILQFNAVVCSNERAIGLYEDLGFHSLGAIPGGFLNKENRYEDIRLFYHAL